MIITIVILIPKSINSLWDKVTGQDYVEYELSIKIVSIPYGIRSQI